MFCEHTQNKQVCSLQETRVDDQQPAEIVHIKVTQDV